MSDCVEKILNCLRSSKSSEGLEFHEFSIGWYNDKVNSKFSLEYDYHTLALCIITTPNFFDDVFVQCVRGEIECTKQLLDPFDKCVTKKLLELKSLFPDQSIDIIQDFEMNPSHRPKVLVQTAGHVSGAAYFYQKYDVKDQPWGDSKICGVSLHPKYSGWFAFRGIMVFKDVHIEMIKKKPIDKLSNADKIKVLEGFNFHWKEWWFRDVAFPERQYSELQKIYFATKPADRYKLLKETFS